MDELTKYLRERITGTVWASDILIMLRAAEEERRRLEKCHTVDDAGSDRL